MIKDYNSHITDMCNELNKYFKKDFKFKLDDQTINIVDKQSSNNVIGYIRITKTKNGIEDKFTFNNIDPSTIFMVVDGAIPIISAILKEIRVNGLSN